jgi:hypothetical protein
MPDDLEGCPGACSLPKGLDRIDFVLDGIGGELVDQLPSSGHEILFLF